MQSILQWKRHPTEKASPMMFTQNGTVSSWSDFDVFCVEIHGIQCKEEDKFQQVVVCFKLSADLQLNELVVYGALQRSPVPFNILKWISRFWGKDFGICKTL